MRLFSYYGYKILEITRSSTIFFLKIPHLYSDGDDRYAKTRLKSNNRYNFNDIPLLA